MKERMNRRVFTGSLIGAGAALATGSKLIMPARALSDDEDNKLINAVASYMTAFADAWDNGYPVDWHQFAGAAMALRAVERFYGLDGALESLYGQDEVATWAGDWAYQEGSWDAFHALVSLGYIFPLADWTSDFDQKQSFQQSNVWINGTGPLSSDIPDCAGWAQCPPYPDTFIAPPSDSGLDDFTRQTVEPPPEPWYSVTSPWIPKVPAVNGFTIWVHNYPKVNKCNTSKWTVYLLAGTVLAMDLLGMKQRFPKYEAAARAVTYIMTGVSIYLCS